MPGDYARNPRTKEPPPFVSHSQPYRSLWREEVAWWRCAKEESTEDICCRKRQNPGPRASINPSNSKFCLLARFGSFIFWCSTHNIYCARVSTRSVAILRLAIETVIHYACPMTSPLVFKYRSRCYAVDMASKTQS